MLLRSLVAVPLETWRIFMFWLLLNLAEFMLAWVSERVKKLLRWTWIGFPLERLALRCFWLAFPCFHAFWIGAEALLFGFAQASTASKPGFACLCLLFTWASTWWIGRKLANWARTVSLKNTLRSDAFPCLNNLAFKWNLVSEAAVSLTGFGTWKTRISWISGFALLRPSLFRPILLRKLLSENRWIPFRNLAFQAFACFSCRLVDRSWSCFIGLSKGGCREGVIEVIPTRSSSEESADIYCIFRYIWIYEYM